MSDKETCEDDSKSVKSGRRRASKDSNQNSRAAVSPPPTPSTSFQKGEIPSGPQQHQDSHASEILQDNNVSQAVPFPPPTPSTSFQKDKIPSGPQDQDSQGTNVSQAPSASSTSFLEGKVPLHLHIKTPSGLQKCSGLQATINLAALAAPQVSARERRWFTCLANLRRWSKDWSYHASLLLVISLYLLLGAAAFYWAEARNEELYRSGLATERASLLQELHFLAKHNTDSWTSEAARRLNKYEESLYRALVEAHVRNDPLRVWTFWNSALYCGTVITTIGYGNIVPTTNLGRVLTILYAVIGIPLFLLLLADAGTLLTRAGKLLWAPVHLRYVRWRRRRRRIYSLAEAPLQELGLSGGLIEQEESVKKEHLPLAVAMLVLVLYVVAGAAMYMLWEDWDFVEAVYFVFISLSTIGFGDYVPRHPIFTVGTVLYITFGLALFSMLICNVLQSGIAQLFFRLRVSERLALQPMAVLDIHSKTQEGNRTLRDTLARSVNSGDSPHVLQPAETQEEDLNCTLRDTLAKSVRSGDPSSTHRDHEP